VADDHHDATRRTRLANERTYLAWLRTGFTALAVAVGVGKIVPGVTDVTGLPFEVIGAGFAVLGIAVVAYGARRFRQVEHALDAGLFAPLDAGAAIALAAVTGALGVAILALVFVH
jgi:inner membrane protein YidH